MARKLTAPQVRALRSGYVHPRGIISPSFEVRTVEVLVGREFADWDHRTGVITDAGRAHFESLRPGTGATATHADNADVAAAVAVLTAAGFTPAHLVGDDVDDPQNRQASGFLVSPRCDTEVRVHTMTDGEWRTGDRTITNRYADALTAAGWDVRQGMVCLFAVRPAADTAQAEAQRAELQRMVDEEAARRPAQGPQDAPQAPADSQEVPSTPNTPAAPQEGPQERRTIGRWESDGGTYWVELYRDAHGYGYDGKGCGGFIGNVTEAEALRFIEPKTVGGAAYFHPGKRPMKRTITPQVAANSDEAAAALLTAEDVAEAVARALRWVGYGAARRRAEAQPASVVLAEDFKRARRVMRRVMKNGAAPVANDALNQYTAAHRVLLAARRIEAEAAAPATV